MASGVFVPSIATSHVLLATAVGPWTCEILAERHCHVRHCRRLRHEEGRPAEEEPGKGAEGFLEVVVLSARFWKHGPEFGVGDRPRHRQQPADDPRRDDERRVRERARHERGRDEDRRSEHRPARDGGDVPRPESPNQARGLVPSPVTIGTGGRCNYLLSSRSASKPFSLTWISSPGT